MNYRHAYHAGNFADVIKHALFVRVIEYLKRKPAPLRIIDTHAGRGVYALNSTEAGKTGEWRDGIGRLLGPGVKPLAPPVAQLLAPYLAAVATKDPAAHPDVYPGSPLLAQRLMRAQDAMIANELHPEDGKALRAALGRDRRIKVMALDGWVAVRSLLPPKERRGVILLDPPFEEDGEFERLGAGLAQGLERFATGIFIVWYPIKSAIPVARFHDALAALPAASFLTLELMIRKPANAERLNGCGLVIVNPPFTLHDDLHVIMPELTDRLARDPHATYRIDRIGPPDRQSAHLATQQPAASTPEPKGRMRTRG
jgi:23S rRNA (adenine2030-N6)-methyltransferase